MKCSWFTAGLAAVGLVLSPAQTRADADYSRSVKRPLPLVVALVTQATKAEGFRVAGTHDLAASLAKEGLRRDPYVVVEICRAEVAVGVLQADPRIGALMPCRIAIFQRGEESVVSTVLPTHLLSLFPGAGAGEAAAAVDAVVKRIIDGAISMPGEKALPALWESANAPYKLALLATSLGDGFNGQQRLAEFAGAWKAFRAALEQAPPPPFDTDARWHDDLRQVSAWAEDAGKQIGAGQLHEAHETLEQVRGRWAEMRRRNGLRWLGDGLTLFHDPMEKTVLALKEKTPATIAPQDLQVVRDALPELRKHLADVRTADLSGLAPADAVSARQLIGALAETVDALAGSLQSGEVDKTLDAGRRLKPAFARLYLKHG